MSKDVDLSRADLNLLVVFEAVLEHGHVGRAAEALNLSPSAVSHALRRLRRMFNDPMFLRAPGGVTPTAKARELTPTILEALQSVRRAVAAGRPFDPATSTRSFTVGAPAGEPLLFMPRLLEDLRRRAPQIDLGIRPILPFGAEQALDDNELDIAITPLPEAAPARFHTRQLFVEEFVTVMRKGHPYAADPTLDAYCSYPHAVMSLTGAFRSPVDVALAQLGRERRVTLTIPSFMSLLAALEHTDMLAAAPRRIVELYGPRFGLVPVRRPFDIPPVEIFAVATRASMRDHGVAWLMATIEDASADLRVKGS